MTIWKSKGEGVSSSPRHAAGDKQERDVAFYLRRSFKDTPDYIVFNDYSFTFNGENAQIDHLIIHRYGFLIVESKSIYGEVKVNKNGEWSRSYKGQWSGIPSPIKQAELQFQLLKSMLRDHVTEFLGKILGLQQGIGGRKWDVLCAVSNTCILHRDNIPKDVNARVIKSEGVVDAVRAIGDKGLAKKIFGSDPAFSHEEMENIANFVMQQATNVELPKKVKEKAIPVETKPVIESPPETSVSYATTVACKNCGEVSKLEGRYGKYGYYVFCAACSTNTSMKQPCPRCSNTKTKISKKKNTYWLNCECSFPYLIFTQDK